MGDNTILQDIVARASKGIKSLAVLIDPDDVDEAQLIHLLNTSLENKVDYFLVGGSLVTSGSIGWVIDYIKSYCNVPVVIFPGNAIQVHSTADAILFLSLISGRNPDLLIGQHVVSAPLLKRSGIQVIPTGYILVNSGHPTSVTYMSHTQPIPRDKPSLAVSTAMAGEMLGLQLLYMDAGSGAENPITTKMIRQVKKNTSVPLVIGGGLNTPQKVRDALEAGADMVVLGNGVQKHSNLLMGASDIITLFNKALNIN